MKLIAITRRNLVRFCIEFQYISLTQTSQVDCQFSKNSVRPYQNILNIFFALGKIVVYSGYPRNNGKNAEVIDLLNPEATCDIYAVLPEGVNCAFGGKVANEFVICGGYTDGSVYSKNCYKVGETAPFVKLIHSRAYGSSAVLSNNTILLLGKFNYFNHS